MPINSIRKEIERVKDDIINHSLIIASILSIITYSIGFSYFFQTGFEWSFITDFSVVMSINVLAIFRKKISMNVKSYIILAGLFILITMDIYEYGIYATNVVLIVLAPFFALFTIKSWQSWILSSLLVVAYFGLAYMHTSGRLTAHDMDFNTMTHWVISFLMILIVAVILIQLVLRFISTYEGMIKNLVTSKKEVEEYKSKLEILVEERTKKLSDKTQELQLAYDSLKTTQKQLIQSDKMASLGLFASGVAHEINNPLNFIRSGIQITEELLGKVKLEPHTKKIEAVMESMNSGVKRAAEIVTSLNMYSRTNEQLDEDCRINEIIDHSLTILNNQIGKEIVVDFDREIDVPTIKGNMGKLHQVFLNITHNAIHAMPNGGKLSVDISVLESDLVVHIKDTGEGIDDEHLDKIIDPFFTTKEVGTGTGLGLFISHSIIEEHKGTLHFDSKRGQGTKVTVTLPVQS